MLAGSVHRNRQHSEFIERALQLGLAARTTVFVPHQDLPFLVKLCAQGAAVLWPLLLKLIL